MLNPSLPAEDYSLVIRTAFTDDAAWDCVCQLIQLPQTDDNFHASVECISDSSLAGLTPQKAASVLPAGSRRPFVFLVDSRTIADPEHPVLVVDLVDEPGRFFRVIPSEAWGIENNLRLANMDFNEFLQSLAEDSVFRGFPQVGRREN